MFGSDMVSIIIMMVFLYLLLSMICSVLSEMVAGALAWRAGTTYKGLRDFFFDPKGAKLVNPVYKHPLVEGLKRPRWWDSVARFGAAGAGKPNEIPFVNFLHALRDTVQTNPPQDPKTKEVVDAVLNGDKEQVEQWWDGAEVTLHNRYKTKMQWLVAIMAILVTGVSNFDTIMVFNALRNDATVSAGLMGVMRDVGQKIDVNSADGIPKALDELAARIQKLGLLGWNLEPKDSLDRRAIPADTVAWITKAIGLLITTIVVARTAPYAFDFFRYAIQYLGKRAGVPQLN